MSPVQIGVTLAGIALAAAVNVWFFAAARPRRASGSSPEARRSRPVGGG